MANKTITDMLQEVLDNQSIIISKLNDIKGSVPYTPSTFKVLLAQSLTDEDGISQVRFDNLKSQYDFSSLFPVTCSGNFTSFITQELLNVVARLGDYY